jgi:membrane protein
MHRAGRAFASFWRKAYTDGITGLAGMVAYSMLLSIFPLGLIALFFAGRVLSSEELERSVVNDLQGIFPSAAASTLRSALETLRQSSTTVGIVALGSALWVASSFWGALDTAFCRIYRVECRSWVRQKLFAMEMLLVVLLFMAGTVAVPTLQSLLTHTAQDLPFGLSDVRGLVYGVTLAAGVVIVFACLCLIYWRVPKGGIPWRCVWPGALGATIATGIVDYAFPLYLTNVSTIRVGSTLVFIFIALIWFYALAIILLAGAIVNDLRFEGLPEEEPAPEPEGPRAVSVTQGASSAADHQG